MRELWPKLVEMNLNTVLGSVTWEMIEMEEGTFEFSEIDRVILDARSAGLKLILLWFGSWKNGMSNNAHSHTLSMCMLIFSFRHRFVLTCTRHFKLCPILDQIIPKSFPSGLDSKWRRYLQDNRNYHTYQRAVG